MSTNTAERAQAYGTDGSNDSKPARAPVEAMTVGVLVMMSYAALGFLRPYAAGTLDDDGVYVTVGKALAEGAGYRNIHLAGEPSNTNYPPGVPLLFALVWKVGGNLAAVQQIISWLNLVVCGAAAAMLWHLSRTRLRLSRSVAVLFVLAPLFLDISVEHYKLAISEPYYLLGWAAVLVLYYEVRDARGTRRELALAALLGLATIAVVALRLQAVGLLPAIVLALVLERRRAMVIAATLAGALLPVVLPLLFLGGLFDIPERLSSAPHFAWLSAGGAARSISFALRAASDNFFIYQYRILHHLASATEVAYALVVIANILLLAGAIYLLRRHPALVFTFVTGVTVVLIWPFNDIRLFIVLLPIAGMIAASGVSLVLETRRARTRRLLVLLLVMVALPVIVRQIQFGYYARVARDRGVAPPAFTLEHALQRNHKVVVSTSDWVLRNTQSQDHIMVAHTAGVYLRTGRKAVESNPPQSLFRDIGPSPFTTPARYLASVILSQTVTVLILERDGMRIGTDVAVIRRECPGVLQPWDEADGKQYPMHYHVQRDERCLQQFVVARPNQ